jgi:hypothetical protein
VADADHLDDDAGVVDRVDDSMDALASAVELLPARLRTAARSAWSSLGAWRTASLTISDMLRRLCAAFGRQANGGPQDRGVGQGHAPLRHRSILAF